jgi:hypothetical protein
MTLRRGLNMSDNRGASDPAMEASRAVDSAAPHGRVAQLAEHPVFNPEVAGSSPAEPLVVLIP